MSSLKDANQTFKFHKQHNGSIAEVSSQNLIVASPAACLAEGPQSAAKHFKENSSRYPGASSGRVTC